MDQSACGISDDDFVHSVFFSLFNDKSIQVWGAGPLQGGEAPLALQPATFHNF